MTTSIVGGWSLLSYTLGRWSSLGYLEGVVAGARFHVRSRCMTRAYRLPNTSVWAVCPRVRSSRTHSRTTGAQALRRGTQTHVLLPQLCTFNTRIPPKLFVPARSSMAGPSRLCDTSASSSVASVRVVRDSRAQAFDRTLACYSRSIGRCKPDANPTSSKESKPRSSNVRRSPSARPSICSKQPLHSPISPRLRTLDRLPSHSTRLTPSRP